MRHHIGWSFEFLERLSIEHFKENAQFLSYTLYNNWQSGVELYLCLSINVSAILEEKKNEVVAAAGGRQVKGRLLL